MYLFYVSAVFRVWGIGEGTLGELWFYTFPSCCAMTRELTEYASNIEVQNDSS